MGDFNIGIRQTSPESHKLDEFLSNLFSPFISAYGESCNTHAYRESYNTQHVLIRLPEEWRKNLDNNYFIRAVLMDFSKAFNCIPHDLVIATQAAYGFDKKNDMLHLHIPEK